jgi:ABC-type sugar transport system permease subunit
MTNGSNIVAIRDIDVPFWRIVLILVKWSIAAIPAMIILTLLVAILGALISGTPASPPH